MVTDTFDISHCEQAAGCVIMSDRFVRRRGRTVSGRAFGDKIPNDRLSGRLTIAVKNVIVGCHRTAGSRIIGFIGGNCGFDHLASSHTKGSNIDSGMDTNVVFGSPGEISRQVADPFEIGDYLE